MIAGWIDRWRLDLSSAARNLLRAPAFSAIAVVSLALGIGANTAIFSIIDAVVLKPLPVSEPDRLVQLGLSDTAFTNPIWERCATGSRRSTRRSPGPRNASTSPRAARSGRSKDSSSPAPSSARSACRRRPDAC